MYCTGTNDQPETSAEQLLTTVAELKSELLEVKSSKDRALKSLHEQESSSMLIQQQCRELEESCAELKSEKDKLLQKIALLHSHPGIWRYMVGAFLQATSRVPRWWIGERPPDMAASCDIYK